MDFTNGRGRMGAFLAALALCRLLPRRRDYSVRWLRGATPPPPYRMTPPED